MTYGNQPAPTFHGGQPVPTPPAGPTNPLAVLSVVFAFVAPPAGIALGHVALWQIKKHNQPGRRLALIGTVLSYVMTVLLIVALVVWLLMSRDEPTPAVAPTGTTAPSAAPPTTTTTSTAPSGPLAWGTPEQILTEEQDDVAVGLDGSVYLADQRQRVELLHREQSGAQTVVDVVIVVRDVVAQRRDLALRYLQDPRMSVGDVGFVLGFLNATAFHRAFKRWTGSTPAQYRRSAPDRGGPRP